MATFFAFVRLAIAISGVIAQTPAELTVALGPSGTCLIPAEETVSVQPVFYSAYFASNTEIDPFRDGHTYIISNAPTVLVVNTVLVMTIYHNGTTSFLPNISTNGPTSSRVPTMTSSASAQAQSSIPPLRLGDGIPPGNISELTSIRIVLGFIDISGVTAGREVQARRLKGRWVVTPLGQSAIQAAVAAAQAATTSNWIMGSSSQPVSCDVATPYTLSGGQLIQNGSAIGKNEGSATSIFGALLSGNANPIVDTGFTFINGILAWQAPDVGIAVFYSCGGIICAVFDPASLLGDALAPFSNCNQVALGGLASASCSAYSAAIALQSSSTTLSVPTPGIGSPTQPAIPSVSISSLGVPSLSFPAEPSNAPGSTISPLNDLSSSLSVNPHLTSLSVQVPSSGNILSEIINSNGGINLPNPPSASVPPDQSLSSTSSSFSFASEHTQWFRDTGSVEPIAQSFIIVFVVGIFFVESSDGRPIRIEPIIHSDLILESYDSRLIHPFVSSDAFLKFCGARLVRIEPFVHSDVSVHSYGGSLVRLKPFVHPHLFAESYSVRLVCIKPFVHTDLFAFVVGPVCIVYSDRNKTNIQRVDRCLTCVFTSELAIIHYNPSITITQRVNCYYLYLHLWPRLYPLQSF
jgi:hypothetical protein